MRTPRTSARRGTPAIRVLGDLGVPFELHVYDFGGLEAGIALEAAEVMGMEPARVLKTLMAVVDAKILVVTLVPADRELSLKTLAGAMGGKRAEMTDVRQAERASGYVKGGISPFGQRQRSPVVVDGSVLQHATVFVKAAGEAWRSSFGRRT